MTKGILLIANNSPYVDYVKQAVYLTKKIHKFLDLPVTIATNSIGYLKKNFDEGIFDNIVRIESNDSNERILFDGVNTQRTIQWHNASRIDAYDLSPYDQTLLMDTDYIINNNLLKKIFDSPNTFMLYKKAYDLSQVRNTKEFERVSDTSIDFYWATVVYFTKCHENKLFFDLIKHIKKEWAYYVRIYRLPSGTYRNDYAFSIAIHIFNGFQSGEFAKELPGKLYYITDQDLFVKQYENCMNFLVAKKDRSGEYSLLKTDNLNVHVMNKMSLQRIIDQESSNV